MIPRATAFAVALGLAALLAGCLGEVAEKRPIVVEIVLLQTTPTVEGVVQSTTGGEPLGGAAVMVYLINTDAGVGGGQVGGASDGSGDFPFAFGPQTGGPAPGTHVLQATVILGPLVGGDTRRYVVP